jgi:ADP-ribosyl-[dinitrogen reductase] hydrolase
LVLINSVIDRKRMEAMREKLVDTILGCIVGGALGDGAGAACEGAQHMPEGLDWRSAEWQLTDDTQLTLATCEALTEVGKPDPEVLAAHFLRWFRAGRLTGLGASTLKALRDLDVGAHWALAGRKGERAAGNGAAMRIAPLAFCVDPRGDESRRLIRDVCRITHHSDEAYAGALAVVLAIDAAKHNGFSLEETVAQLPDTSVRDRLAAYAALPAHASLADAVRRFGTSGYVVESVPLALFAAAQVHALGFATMLKQVIAVGGDTDTNAAVAGQVAGATLGFGGLPQDLVDKLPQSDLVLSIAQAFPRRWRAGSDLPSTAAVVAVASASMREHLIDDLDQGCIWHRKPLTLCISPRYLPRQTQH